MHKTTEMGLVPVEDHHRKATKPLGKPWWKRHRKLMVLLSTIVMAVAAVASAVIASGGGDDDGPGSVSSASAAADAGSIRLGPWVFEAGKGNGSPDPDHRGGPPGPSGQPGPIGPTGDSVGPVSGGPPIGSVGDPPPLPPVTSTPLTTTTVTTTTTTSTTTTPVEPVVLNMRGGGVQEGDVDVPGARRKISFSIWLSRATSSDVTFDFETQSATAIVNEDYAGESSRSKGRLRIPAGATRTTFDVYILSDQVVEADEYFYLTLYNAAGASIDGQDHVLRSVGTITNDDIE